MSNLQETEQHPAVCVKTRNNTLMTLKSALFRVISVPFVKR
jgi:hypothetical protein